MAKVSRASAAQVDDHGVVEDRHEDVAETTIQFLTIRQDIDASPLFKGLPDDRCPCPHWGYVFKGRLTFRVGDREEVYEAGDAFSSRRRPPPRVPSLAPSTCSSVRANSYTRSARR